jgi:hypothetical protein
MPITRFRVKSTPNPWVFDKPGSVKWILQYPAPLLLCIVDKKGAQFSVYQLRARLQAAAMAELPTSLTLVPASPGKTDPTHRPAIGWDADGKMQLGPPILHFARAGRTTAEHLDWLGQSMLASGDSTGALLAALLVRHLVHDEDPRLLGFSPTALYGQLRNIVQQAFPDVAANNTLVGPFDAILAELKRRTQGSE